MKRRRRPNAKTSTGSVQRVGAGSPATAACRFARKSTRRFGNLACGAVIDDELAIKAVCKNRDGEKGDVCLSVLFLHL